jgi:hypothetical protein
MTFPDNIALRDYCKMSLRLSLTITTTNFSFTLPTHKSDRYFEGDRILIQKSSSGPNALAAMTAYVKSRDRRCPLHPHLWLTSDGSIPTRSWFLLRLKRFFPSNIAGHSMRAGGATALAQAGASADIIKAAGRWSSNAFERYIRKNPFLMHAMMIGQTSAFDGPN